MNGIRPSGYDPGPSGRLEPCQSGLEEPTNIYCSRKSARFAWEIVWPEGPVRSATVTLTLVSAVGALTTIWKDSDSPLAAESCATVPLPAGSDCPTRCRLGAIQTDGPCATRLTVKAESPRIAAIKDLRFNETSGDELLKRAGADNCENY